jgi:putative cell wall-binding protein/uncharacterized protein (DUF2141 family)
MHQGISRFRKLAVAAVATVATTAGLLPLAAVNAGATASFDLTRFAGADRYDTAAKISAGTFTTATDVVVTTGENFPDALAGNYLAGTAKAPILLTRKGDVPATTQAEINRLHPQRVWVLGGTDAVGAGGVPTTSGTVTRIGGATRYETAAQASSTGTVGTLGGLATAIVATGDKFADALSAGPAAFSNNFPLYLTPGAPATALHPATKSALTARGIKHVILMGGTNAVSAAVESEIQAMGITTERAAGVDRTETARNFAEQILLAKLGYSTTHMNVARGDLYPDALSGGPHAGTEKAPILLTWTPTAATADGGSTTGVLKYASDHKATLTGGHIFGGTDAVSAAVETAIETAGGAPSSQTIAVSPATSSSQANNSSRQYSVTSSGPVTIALFACNNVRQNSSGQTVFTTSGGQALQGTVAPATITVVNGSPASTTAPSTSTSQKGVTSSSGTITFTVSGNGTTTSPGTCVVPVVFTDVNNNGALDTDANGVPTEPVGVGGATIFTPGAATSGAIAAGSVVVGTDKANDKFVACDSTVTTCSVYSYDANDVFTVDGVSVGLAAFEAAISPSDTLSGTSYTSDPAGQSVFNLVDSNPVAPAQGTTTATVSSTAPTSSIVLTFPDSATPTNDAYNIYRVVADPGPTCPNFNTLGATGRGRFTKIATVNDKSGTSNADTAYTYTDTGLGSNTTYCYAITAVDEGDESPTGATAQAATASPTPTAVPGAPISVSATFQDVADAGAGQVSSGDVLTVVFNEAMDAPSVGDSITLTDGDGTTGTITNGVNATFTLVTTGTNANKVIQITLTGPVQISGAGTTAGLQYGSATVVSSTGNTDADEHLNWDLATSTDKTF